MIYQAGVYRQDNFIVPDGETWEAAPNACVIFTSPDGTPPSLAIGKGATLRGIWVGGTRETVAGQSVMYLMDDAIADNCAFFGHYGGFIRGGQVRGAIRNCVFVGCGYGTHSHPIYISTVTPQAGDGIEIDNNLFLNCEGYAVHLWNDHLGGTHWNRVTRNFIHGFRGIVSKGHDNAIQNNVFWRTTSTHSYLEEGERLVWTQNLYHQGVYPYVLVMSSPDALIRNNAFVAPTPAFGSSPDLYTRATINPIIGRVAPINTAINELVAAFANAQSAQLELSIEPNIEFLRNVVSQWVSRPMPN